MNKTKINTEDKNLSNTTRALQLSALQLRISEQTKEIQQLNKENSELKSVIKYLEQKLRI